MAQLEIVGLVTQVIIDDEDYYNCSQHRWYWSGTVVYNHNLGSLAKFILQTKELVDHKDRNPFNFRRLNLRVANKSLNAANTDLSSINSSGYKGVFYRANRRHWYAKIQVNGKEIYLGAFKTKEEASQVYDNAAEKHFGEFARTNKMIAAGG